MICKHKEYKHCKSTSLKETSKDDNNEYMPNIDDIGYINVIDFDNVKDRFVELNKINNSPKSVDALYEYGDLCYLIEFKNTEVKSSDVAYKLYDSIIILSCINNIDILKLKEKCIYIVVYNKEKNKDINKTSKKTTLENYEELNKFANNLSKHHNEDENIISFKLSRYKGFLCKEIYTWTAEEFNYNFKELCNISM